jgi:hypothetical protein
MIVPPLMILINALEAESSRELRRKKRRLVVFHDRADHPLALNSDGA